MQGFWRLPPGLSPPLALLRPAVHPMAPMSLGTQLAGLAPTPVRAATGARCQQRASAVPTLRSATKVAASASGFDFTPEQQRAAMEKQLRLSAERAAAEEERKRQAAARGAAAAEAPSVIPKRKQPRRAARLAAAAAAAKNGAAAAQQSTAAQQQLAARLGDLDEHTMAAALRAQLKQSGTFDEADPTELLALEVSRRTGNGAAHRAARGGAGANGAVHGAPLAAGSKIAAAEAAVFEEGSLRVGAGEGANLEDMLTA
ncbi:expressed protein [Chlorella variabilis]|uniref:Expressed protein n=1 Tax=Chlorella variabilis TaxID=554065 RepID=E1ZB37_CHLVA|nr:expressed protein [Chlorella variabilis]EFN56956.1 expressed protein [Chlorella variabilis]|eukprot:XP_005849058.1 expressed protein [Chlorella variabilis]